jgi:AraC-like DNA-binding protein
MWEHAMPRKKPERFWTTAPERHYRDVVSPTPSLDVDRIRDILHRGIASLIPENPDNLILPPPRAVAPRRVDKQKDLHDHRYVEVGMVLHGEMGLWWEGMTCTCPVGSLIVIPPGTRYLPHVFVGDKPVAPHSVVWLALHRGSAVAHVCRLEGRTHWLSEYYRFTESQITGLARNLAQELADRFSYYEIAVRGTLLCLLTCLLRAPIHSISRHSGVDHVPQEGDQDSFQKRVEDYLLSHYHRPVTLAQIAGSLGCSPSYLCRHFRALTGQTPFQYLRNVRIETAKRLLLSEVPIARVAEMVGFDDPLYFSKVFTGVVGASPRGYRTQHKRR